MLAMYNGQYNVENDSSYYEKYDIRSMTTHFFRNVNFPCPTMKNLGLGPPGPLIMDPIYVICVYGWMVSCSLCERQKFSESHKLKCFGAQNQFRAARFVTVLFIACSINAME